MSCLMSCILSSLLFSYDVNVLSSFGGCLDSSRILGFHFLQFLQSIPFTGSLRVRLLILARLIAA